VVIQHIDGTLVDSTEQPSHSVGEKQTFYTEIPHHLLDSVDGWIDRLFGFAFDTLDAQHIELRVIDPERDI